MKREINNKRKEHHDGIRKAEIQQYKRIIRQSLLKEQTNTVQIQQLNQITIKHINNKDLLALYSAIFKQNCLQKLQSLDKVILLELFLFLLKTLQKTQSILLATSLIDCQYKYIFLTQTNNILCRQFVQTIYEILGKRIQEYVLTKEDTTLKLINIYFNCLKSLIYNKPDKNENNYMFQYVLDQHFVRQYIVNWLTHQYDNPFYLIILYFCEIQHCVSAQPQFKQFLQANIWLLKILIDQIQMQSLKDINLALPSMLIANAYIKQISNDKIMEELLCNYILKFKFVYGMVQDKIRKPYFKMNHMYTMIDVLRLIFEDLSKRQNKTTGRHLGTILNQSGAWKFFALIFRIQTNYMRRQMYFLINMAVENMLVNKVRLQQFIQNNFLYFFIQGLEQTQDHEIILNNLQIIQYLIQYDMMNYERQKTFTNILDEYELKYLLQNLQHFTENQQIQKQAYITLKLTKKLQEIQSKQIDLQA